MKQETITPDKADRPIARMIDTAISYGYKYNPELTAEQHLRKVKEWLYEKYEIWVWVSASSTYFFPWFLDRRNPQHKKQKGAQAIYPEEALNTGLRDAMSHIDKTNN